MDATPLPTAKLPVLCAVGPAGAAAWPTSAVLPAPEEKVIQVKFQVVAIEAKTPKQGVPSSTSQRLP